MEKKITAKEAVKAHLRAIRTLHRISPRFFPVSAFLSVISALVPYITVFCSANILNELAGMRREEVLWLWVIVTVAVISLLSLGKALLNERRETLWDDLHGRKEKLYAKKMFSMDYADMDRQQNQDLRAQIQQNENWAGWGMMRTVTIFKDGLEGITGILSGIALTVTLFTQPVPETAGKLVILNHPIFILLLAGLLIGASLLAGRIEGMATECWSSVSEEATFCNRLFRFWALLWEKKERSCDIRMYHQDTLAKVYWNGDSSFGVDGSIGKLARGKMGVYAGLGQGITAPLIGLIYLFVCLKAWGGAFAVGSVTQYVGAVTALAVNIHGLSYMIGLMKTNTLYLNQTYEFLDIPNAMYQGSLTTEKRSDRQYEVEFRNVSFRYPGSELWALKQVSLRFKVGKRLAIVGENGSGKTTFIKLLCRLYDPQEGQILLNGIDIRKYNYRDYMDIFSVVFQDFQLISQSLGSNVAGSREYDHGRVEKALIDAGFGERLASMPQGLDTQLYKDFGENGVEVSGGEAQKIAIARALYKDAPFIILDEPTAALDPLAEAEIYEKFDRIAGDKTAIYISHRLSSCKFCDEIAVFHDGAVIQQGSHEELLEEKKGKYAELWNAQAQYYTTTGTTQNAYETV